MLGNLNTFPLCVLCQHFNTVTSDDQVKAYIKKIMSQLNKWMTASKISKLVIVITSKEMGETVERWQFDVHWPWCFSLFCVMILTANRSKSSTRAPRNTRQKTQVSQWTKRTRRQRKRLQPAKLTVTRTNPEGRDAPDLPPPEKSDKEIQLEIQSIFRQITASVTFLPELDAGACTFNVLVYADADSEVPMEWGDSDAREVENGEKVQLRSFSTSSHRVDTLVSYR